MSDDSLTTAALPVPEDPPQADLTGRDRMAWNVIASWAGELIFIVAGFIMPRMIDRRLGQETLGIWDFSWSMVAYFGLVTGGIASSVNRYVAKYRARGETDNVNGFVSSITCLLCGMGLLVLGLTVLLCWLLPSIWGQRLGAGVSDAQVVLGALGASMASQVVLGAFSGIITGCHRWDIHNYIKAGWYLVTVVAMIILLQLGMGIKSLAVASLAGAVLADLHRVVYSFRVCPGLRLRVRFVRGSMIRDALRFGAKTLIPSIGYLLMNQTSSVLIASFLGPAALAMFSRPKSLAQHVSTLVSRLAFVLTPAASALHSTNRREELQELFINTTRYAAFISLPLTIGLAIMGGPLLHLWMGPGYANGTLIALIVVGNFAVVTFLPVWSILAGMNAHGRPGIMNLPVAVCSVGMVFLALGPLKMGLEGVALAVGLPLTAYGIWLSAYACKRLEMSWRRFLSGAFAMPLVCMAPFAACLGLFRCFMSDHPIRSLWVGTLVAGAILAIMYWHCMIPLRIRLRVLRLIRTREVVEDNQ